MKSLQARLQSRISKRSSYITELLEEIRDYRGLAHRPIFGSRLVGLKEELRQLEQDQVLDKQMISNVYWAGV